MAMSEYDKLLYGVGADSVVNPLDGYAKPSKDSASSPFDEMLKSALSARKTALDSARVIADTERLRLDNASKITAVDTAVKKQQALDALPGELSLARDAVLRAFNDTTERKATSLAEVYARGTQGHKDAVANFSNLAQGYADETARIAKATKSRDILAGSDLTRDWVSEGKKYATKYERGGAGGAWDAVMSLGQGLTSLVAGGF